MQSLRFRNRIECRSGFQLELACLCRPTSALTHSAFFFFHDRTLSGNLQMRAIRKFWWHTRVDDLLDKCNLHWTDTVMVCYLVELFLYHCSFCSASFLLNPPPPPLPPYFPLVPPKTLPPISPLLPPSPLFPTTPLYSPLLPSSRLRSAPLYSTHLPYSRLLFPFHLSIFLLNFPPISPNFPPSTPYYPHPTTPISLYSPLINHFFSKSTTVLPLLNFPPLPPTPPFPPFSPQNSTPHLPPFTPFSSLLPTTPPYLSTPLYSTHLPSSRLFSPPLSFPLLHFFSMSISDFGWWNLFCNFDEWEAASDHSPAPTVVLYVYNFKINGTRLWSGLG